MKRYDYFHRAQAWRKMASRLGYGIYDEIAYLAYKKLALIPR
jgi:hypothetical protein